MGEFVKILMVILISSVKFVVGPAFAYYDEKYDFTIFEAIVYPIIGGMLGVFVFSFFSDQVANVWHWIKNPSLLFWGFFGRFFVRSQNLLVVASTDNANE